MGMLQKYRNKLKADRKKKLEEEIEGGKRKVKKLKVRVPGVPKKKK